MQSRDTVPVFCFVAGCSLPPFPSCEWLKPFRLVVCFFAISGNLEREMKLLFGSRLRAEGGDGTLTLDT